MKGLEFRADDNCTLGSKYITGKGCKDSLFENYEEVMNDPSKLITEPESRVTIEYFPSKSSADLMKFTQHRNNF